MIYRHIFDKIDTDSDTFVTYDELKKWLNETHNRVNLKTTKAQLKGMDTDKDGQVSWAEYAEDTQTQAESENGM